MESQRQNNHAAQLRDYGRGLAGGLIFGLPVLLTQEVWNQGFLLRPLHLVVFLVVHYLLLLGLVWVAGFKAEAEMDLSAVAFEAIETLGLAFLESTVLLFLFGQATLELGSVEFLSKVLLETIPVSIGVAIATSQLKGEERSEGGGQEGGRRAQESGLRAENETGDGEAEKSARRRRTNGQYVVALGGAAYMAYNFAPIEEMTVIALSMDWVRHLALIWLSLILTFGLVFSLEFKGGSGRNHESFLERPWVETVVSYALSLGVALALLFFFGTVELEDSVGSIVGHMIVLGLPASVGAAAGRLLV